LAFDSKSQFIENQAHDFCSYLIPHARASYEEEEEEEEEEEQGRDGGAGMCFIEALHSILRFANM
jgi:hypothetical protein